MDKQEAAVEREMKFSAVDHDDLRRRLEGLGAENQGAPALEDNWVMDREGQLVATGSILRLRADRRGTRLTFKGPAMFEGSVKVRVEHETGVADDRSLRRILSSLGYEPVRRYQKYREEWRLGSVIIALDHTPIGDFAEIEGDGCETVARRLDLDLEHLEKRNYMRLYEDYLKANPEAPPDMVFQQGSGRATP